jgi:hypothetical protein
MTCKGFDGQVARREEELQRLSREFVCVRLVKMNGVDLSQFQFDYDQSWAAFFLHPDGAVYARYGSRSAAGPMATNSVPGLVAAMKRVLEAHRGYPANRELFAAKRGPEPRFRRPEEIPSPIVRRRQGAVTRGTCIHCHEVNEALLDAGPSGARRLPETVYRYPLPENIGIEIDPDAGNRIDAVLPGSAAEKAGLRAGDVLSILNGQAVYSIADIQFILHHLPAEAELAAAARRNGEEVRGVLRLSGNWRRSDFSWRASMKGSLLDPGLYLHMIPDTRKKELGIEEKHAALEVRGLFKPEVQRSGLREGDIIISYDGKRDAISSPRLQDYIAVHHFEPGSVLALEVLRAGELRRIEVKF